MSNPYAPDSRAAFAASVAPRLRRAYPVLVDGFWSWSATGPQEAAVVVGADDTIMIDPAGTVNEVGVAMDANGSPVFLG